MKSITFENLRRLMGGGRKKKDKETSFKRSDSFKRISIRKSYLDRGKKKHLQKLEVATQTMAEEVVPGSSSSSKVDSSVQVDKVEEVLARAKSPEPPERGVAYGQWLKGIKVEDLQEIKSSKIKGKERTVIYIPASNEPKPACPVIRQLSSSPTFHKKTARSSPVLQRKESNDSAVEVFPWGNSGDFKKSPLIRRKARPTSPPSLLPDSGAEEMCSLSISLGRIWMDAPQGMAPRSLELPKSGCLPPPIHHSLDSALKDRKEDPIVINRLQKKSAPPVARTLSSTSNTTTSTGIFSSKDSGFSFSLSVPKLTDFNSSTGAIPTSKGFFRRKRPVKPKLSVSKEGYFKRTSGGMSELRESSTRRRSSRKKKGRGSGRRKKRFSSSKNDMYQVIVSRPSKSTRTLKLDPMIFVPPEKRRSSLRRKQSFKAGVVEIRHFNAMDESMYRTLVDSADEGLYELLPGDFETFSDEQPPSGRISRISLREDDYDYPSNDFAGVDRVSEWSLDDDNEDDYCSANDVSCTVEPPAAHVPLGVSPVPRRRPVRRKKSGLSRRKSITYLAKPNIMRAPSTLRRPAKKNGKYPNRPCKICMTELYGYKHSFLQLQAMKQTSVCIRREGCRER